MITQRKAKQFLTVAAKLLIVAAAFYFIATRLSQDESFKNGRFVSEMSNRLTWPTILFLLLLSFLNRFFEILKWQNLAQVLRPISVAESSKQVLGALTVSIFTPNGIGEYGAKALFFKKEQARQVVFLNLVCNGIQMVLTIIFGILGLLYFNAFKEVITTTTVAIIAAVFFGAIALSFFVRNLAIRGYSISRLVAKVGSLSGSIHRKNTLLAIGRYIFFSHQYYVLFVILGVDLPYFVMMSAITSVYFLASALPTFQFLDFAVKGGVAVYFFSLLGVSDWIPVFVTTAMWLLNVVLPVAIGSYYVISFKPQWKR